MAEVRGAIREANEKSIISSAPEDERTSTLSEGSDLRCRFCDAPLRHTFLNSFVRGMKRLLANDGVITMGFPHLMRLMEENQFDTIYHEHFSYFSFIATERDGWSIAGYGAPGKGNTLLNYCGIRADFLDYIVDRNPYKQEDAPWEIWKKDRTTSKQQEDLSVMAQLLGNG